MTVLFCIACDGGYSGWVPSACPIFKSSHHHLRFDISSECLKFNGHRTSNYRDICMKLTPQSIWIHCTYLYSIHTVWHLSWQLTLMPWQNERIHAKSSLSIICLWVIGCRKIHTFFQINALFWPTVSGRHPVCQFSQVSQMMCLP